MTAGGPAEQSTAATFRPPTWLALRLLWWLLLPLALTALGVTLWSEHRGTQASVRALLPAGVVMIGEGRLYPFSPEAAAAGLRAGDTVATVDGVAVDTPSGIIGPALAAANAGRPLRVQTLDGQGVLRRVVLQRSPETAARFRRLTGADYPVIAWALIANSLLLNLVWLTGSLLLFRRREALPAILSLGGLGLVAGGLWTYVPGEPTSAWRALGALIEGTSLVAVGYGLLGFPDGRLGRWRTILLGVVGLGSLFYAAAEIVDASSEGWAALTIMGTLTGAAVSLIMRWRASRSGIARQQMKWAAGGLLFSLLLIIAGVLVFAYVQLEERTIGIIVWGTVLAQLLIFLAMSAPMAGLLVALMRFRLYDAESLIGRSAAVGVLTVGALAIWTAVEKVLRSLLEGFFGAGAAPGVAGLFAVLTALLVVPARKRLSRWTQRRLQPGVAALQVEVPERLRDLRETATPDDLAQIVAEEVAKATRATRAAILSGDGATVDAATGLTRAEVEHWTASRAGAPPMRLQTTRDAVFPLVVPLPAAVGASPDRWLALGPRPDGTPPSADDRRAVAELATPIGRALSGAAAREARDADLRAEIQSLRVELRMLNQRLAAS